MAYLYQAINNVPGLSGSSYQRQKQLYERMGSPMGAYKGSAQQNNWLLSQINSGAATKAMQPKAAAPAPAPAQPKQDNLAKDIANQAGANKVTKAPVFDEVLPFHKAWGNVLPAVQEEAAAQINPVIARQLAQQNEQFYKQLAGRGGGRFGSSWGQLGTMQAEAERNRKSQIIDWTNARQQGFKTLWYDPTEQAYNRAIEQNKVPGTPTPITWDQFNKQYNPGNDDLKDDMIPAPGENPANVPGGGNWIQGVPGSMKDGMYTIQPYFPNNPMATAWADAQRVASSPSMTDMWTTAG